MTASVHHTATGSAERCRELYGETLSFICAACRRLCCACVGAADSEPDLCDDCAGAGSLPATSPLVPVISADGRVVSWEPATAAEVEADLAPRPSPARSASKAHLLRGFVARDWRMFLTALLVVVASCGCGQTPPEYKHCDKYRDFLGASTRYSDECESLARARRDGPGECIDSSMLVATTAGSPNGYSCPFSIQTMIVEAKTVSGEEIGALVKCVCPKAGAK